MTTRLKLRRGTTTQHATFAGAVGEVTVDTTKNALVVHDGTTVGGFPAIRDTANVIATSNIQAGAVTSAKLAAGAAQANFSFTPANDTAVVHKTGAETIAGVKTFSSSPVLPGNATTSLQAVPKQQLDAFTPTALSTAVGSAPSYSARVWLNMNGTGTVSIRGSGNVSSIRDNGIGDYTVVFTSNMVNTNYSTVCGVGAVGGGVYNSDLDAYPVTQLTNEVQIQTKTGGAVLLDPTLLNVAIFG